MKAYMHIILYSCLIISCSTRRSGVAANNDKNCIPFFKYDKVVHYRVAISSDSVASLFESERRNSLEEQLFTVLSDRYQNEKYEMNDLADTSKLMNLEKLGFERKEISRQKFSELDRLFCERHYDADLNINLCLPVYRDIILFRNQNRIVGFVRLCFDCEMSNIVGSDHVTVAFGQAGEFQVLEQLLN